MKKYIVTAIMALSLSSAFAQEDGRKTEKKEQKMDKKELQADKAQKKHRLRKADKKTEKMVNKEQKMDKKADERK